MLLQNFIASLTVVLPFYPVGTMERVVKEGQVATANTYAQVHTHIHIRPPSRLCAVWVVGRSSVRFWGEGRPIAVPIRTPAQFHG